MHSTVCGASNSPSTVKNINEVLTDSNQSQSAVSDQNQTSPVVSPPNMVRKGLDEEMHSTVCGASNSPSTAKNINEVPTDSNQNQSAVSDQNQTSPVVSPPNTVRKGLDEEMHSTVCGASNSPSTVKNINEVLTDSNQSQSAVSDQNQTSPVVSPPNMVRKGLDEEMHSTVCGASNSPSTVKNINEVPTDSNQNQSAVSDQNQKSPVVSPPNTVRKVN
ncbi:uncharacterized protein LOC115430655 [Sphaeramia orbicularis]|uniref:uncharacterized protein LOC115430655 n=1 Tax=Sphaeramia orbicularis TaxID=375764 RepID=UPI001180BF8C|nr:uncharacterized protein LOC115430655 [Sphaeramia orbicularis]